MVRGAFLEPGEIIILEIFFAWQCETIDCAVGIAEYFIKFKNTTKAGYYPKVKRLFTIQNTKHGLTF